MSKLKLQGIKGCKQLGHVVYDFDKDGGAFGTPIDLFELSANTIVHDFWCEVETAPASLGLATLEVGITGGDTDAVIAQDAFGAFALDSVSSDVMKGADLWDGDGSLKKKYTAATILSLLIGTAALTAGKVHFYCEYSAGY